MLPNCFQPAFDDVIMRYEANDCAALDEAEPLCSIQKPIGAAPVSAVISRIDHVHTCHLSLFRWRRVTALSGAQADTPGRLQLWLAPDAGNGCPASCLPSYNSLLSTRCRPGAFPGRRRARVSTLSASQTRPPLVRVVGCFRMTKRRKWIVGSLAAIGVLMAGGAIHYKAKFPYGQSHCCINQMSGALEQYAEENGGKYPTGGATPKASLTLLYKSNYIDAYVLRGMTLPERTVQSILDSGRVLGPDSCGWHYVPGLTRADDSGLALLWCKDALGHNGDRTRDGGRQVVFVGRGIEWIPGDRWRAFLNDQKTLVERRSTRAVSGNPLVTGSIELPDGSRLDRFDGSCTIREETKGPNSSGHGSSSGRGCDLRWYQPPIQDGAVTRTLSFSNLVSDPVTMVFVNGIPDATNFVYRMRSVP